ncbi:MAG TPA: TRAP transporter fused permease subunit [Candidatus Limnocylindrales bacterium]|nr:TRAP transporter fused permease subunit [Candidatus Limnocylindrales bacterium]
MNTPGDRSGPREPSGPGGGDTAAGSVDAAAVLAEYEAEKPARTLHGLPGLIVGVLGTVLSLLALAVVLRPVQAHAYRAGFLLLVLVMTFLVYRGWSLRRASDRARDESADAGRAVTERPGVTDVLLALLSVVAVGYLLLFLDAIGRRAARPTEWDIVFGTLTVLLVLEATRRTVGWLLPAICIGFVAYAFAGPLMPSPFDHRGYDLARLVGHSYQTLEGIFGVPLDVAATYIVLFTIYGAVLEYSGASRFFLDLSFAAFGRSGSGPGRTVTVAGFLLGTVSGSGVATTVTLGTVAWPVLRRAGYPPAEGGGVLAAAGIGAILSPPTLGAAAFIIAEYLGVSYLQVLLYATIPTVLYYLGIILAIEMDARRYRTRPATVETPPLRQLLLGYGYHFSSLVAIVVFMALGVSAFRAVFYAILLAVALSFLRRETSLMPPRLGQALRAGAAGVLPVAATCAAAGIVVAVVTLTGLGLKLSSIIVGLAGGSLALTALLSGVAVLLLGLAVPVTASFIIASVIIAPALTTLGVPAFAAYMFIFYYAVLSEVSPPTALSAFAAAAITGARPFRTMLQTWKYTLPAFLVPFIFVLAPRGEALLLVGDLPTIILVTVVAAAAVGSLAVATGAWLLGPAGPLERLLFGLAGILLLYLEPQTIALGVTALAAGTAVRLVRRRMASAVPA